MMKEKIVVEGEHLMPTREPKWNKLGRYGNANLVVVSLQVIAWVACMYILDAQSLDWWLKLIALLFFCFMMQGVFTMLHEFCHGNAHRDKRVNYFIGWVAATLFGTSPTLLQIQHWGHHRRNRSQPERAEFVHEGENRWLKTGLYYFAVLGGIWLASFIFSILSPLLPYSAVRYLSRSHRFNTFSAGFSEFSAYGWRRMQMEGLLLLLLITALVVYGPWHWDTLVLAYAAFAFSWSSLQWVYHMYTPIHVVEGAYNLRAPWMVRVLFLNFNYNLTHHRNFSLPWQELKDASDQRETQPLWYRYILIFRPPVRFPDDLSILEKKYF